MTSWRALSALGLCLSGCARAPAGESARPAAVAASAPAPGSSVSPAGSGPFAAAGTPVLSGCLERVEAASATLSDLARSCAPGWQTLATGAASAEIAVSAPSCARVLAAAAQGPLDLSVSDAEGKELARVRTAARVTVLPSAGPLCLSAGRYVARTAAPADITVLVAPADERR